MKNGLFKVFTTNGSQKQNKGTAFAIRTSNKDGIYYLLTAYHVICELSALGKPILVEDDYNSSFLAKLLYPTDLSMDYRQYGNDYALLCIYTDEEYYTYPLYESSQKTDCYIRGCASLYSSSFSSLEGTAFFPERIEGQNYRSLQLMLNVHLSIGKDYSISSSHEMLQGFSGSPVLKDTSQGTVCIGNIGNLEKTYTATYQYAVPISTVISDCLKPGEIPYVTFIDNMNPFEDDSYKIELLIGNTDEFLFSDEKLEFNTWNMLSNSFYRGRPVIESLKYIIESDAFNQESSEVRCAIYYYYSRLLFKCGKTEKAFKVLSEISQFDNLISNDSRLKLNALVNSRMTIESDIENPNATLESIRSSGEGIINIPTASDEYKAAEMASIFGRGLTNIFGKQEAVSQAEKESLIKIFQEHESLLIQHPEKLCKQDVVNTSLKWFLGFWQVDTSYDIQELMKTIITGFSQSAIRKNNIFYIQCLLAYSVVSYLDNHMQNAVRLLLMTIKLMKKENIKFDHEGIHQLFMILKEKSISLYSLANMAYYSYNKTDFSNKANLIGIDLGISNWYSILTNVDNVYNIKYAKTGKLYSVDFNTVKVLLAYT